MFRRFMRYRPGLGLGLTAALLAGCEGESTTGPRIVNLAVVSGLGQSGLVGAELASPLVVRVADQAGRPVAGALVTWTVVSGGGTITPSQSVTDSEGRASASFRLGATVGVQVVRASLGDALSVTFSATAQAAPPSQVTISSGNNQSATVLTALPQRLVVRVADAFNNAKPGIAVLFQVVSGGGTLSASSATTDAQGLAGVDWTLGQTAGPQLVSATVAGLAPVVFTATALAAAPAQVVVAGGNNQSAPPGARLPDSLVARVLDAFGNPVKDVTVSFAPVGDAGLVSPAVARTDANGRAATTWTLGATGGPKQVRATVGALAAVFQAAGTIVFASVNAGGRHTCGLDVGGVLYCWGFNGDGQLGMGQAAQGSGPVFAGPQPTAVTGALTFAAVRSGSFHTCGWTLSANPYCWGKNVDGRVGNANFEQANAPAHVAGVHVFNRIGAGGTHTCALTLGGRLYCWGSNAEGQVGIVGAAVIPPDSLAFNIPMAVMPAVTWSDVASGGLHACAVRSDGVAYCWGNNAAGQLGTGSFANANTPASVLGPAEPLVAITAGERHTCALTDAGAAWCWGDNQHGQLGDGSAVSSNVPVAVTGGLVFTALTAGAHHTCGLTAGGIAWCWGLNANGQLGDGTTTSAQAPVAVGGGHVFANLSAGARQTCGVTTGNTAYCWGDNQFGQLGDGTQQQRLLPRKVTFQP